MERNGNNHLVLGVSGVGNSEVRENEERLLWAVMKAETVLMAQTAASGGRKSNSCKIFLFIIVI